MGFCRGCGSRLPDGVKFCENCGTRVDTGMEIKKKVVQPTDYVEDDFDYDYDIDDEDYVMKKMVTGPYERHSVMSKPVPNKFGKFWGIGLLILAIIDFMSDPPIVTILLSLFIISGAIFCFIKKYKLRFFTIMALILAVICLLCGIGQGRKYGMFKIPKDNDYVAATEIQETDIMVDKDYYSDDMDELNVTNESDFSEDTDINEQAEEQIEGQSANETETEITDEEVDVSTESESTGGVNPDLKAFLDSYEDFMDEYVEFMKKYQSNPNNALSMMGDYMKILSKYEEFAKTADSYDQDEMSKEDLAYYIEAMARIEKKMLEAL